MIKGVVIAVGKNTIYHTLGRAWVGWIVTKGSANSHPIFEDSSTVEDKHKDEYLVVWATAAQTIDIWIF